MRGRGRSISEPTSESARCKRVKFWASRTSAAGSSTRTSRAASGVSSGDAAQEWMTSEEVEKDLITSLQGHTWSQTAEIMASMSKSSSFRTSKGDRSARGAASTRGEDEAVVNSNMQVLMHIRTEDDPSVTERRKFTRRLLVHPSERWLREWMGFVYLCLVANMVIIPFRGVFDPFGEVTCTVPDDRSSCSATGVEPTLYSIIDWCAFVGVSS